MLTTRTKKTHPFLSRVVRNIVTVREKQSALGVSACSVLPIPPLMQIRIYHRGIKFCQLEVWMWISADSPLSPTPWARVWACGCHKSLSDLFKSGKRGGVLAAQTMVIHIRRLDSSKWQPCVTPVMPCEGYQINETMRSTPMRCLKPLTSIFLLTRSIPRSISLAS